MSLALQSAHQDKANPIAMADFKKHKFTGNVTAYKVAWDHFKPEKFPIESHKDIGVSKKSFAALKILFPYLDLVFRARGTDYVPEEHSTVANHLKGLQNICDDIFTEAQTEIQAKFEKLVRLSLIVHDIPEIPGEISSYKERLPESGDITELERHQLEEKLAGSLLYLALEASYEGKNILDEKLAVKITDIQNNTQSSASAVERYKKVNEFYQSLPKIDLSNKSKAFKRDYNQLLAAYHLFEDAKDSEQFKLNAHMLAQLIDKLESKAHIGMIGRFDPSANIEHLDKYFKKDLKKSQSKLETLYQVDFLKPIVQKFAQIYNNAQEAFFEWSVLKTLKQKLDLTAFGLQNED